MRSLILVLLFTFSANLAFALELTTELAHGLYLVNNGQLLEAYDFFKQYAEKHPEDERGLFLFALAKWRMMWLSTYNRADRTELLNLLDRVEGICLPIMNENKDALFYYASTQGLRAQLAATENEWWDTAQLGKKMKNHAERLIKKDPNYHEAYYLLGTFNYFADALPGYLKFLRVLVFLPGGDRTEGMKQLILAYQEGMSVSAEAGKTLAIIYTFYEGRSDYGIRMCDNILFTYPGSYDIGLYKGINLYFSMSWEKSLEWLQMLRKDVANYSTTHHQQEQQEKASIVPIYVSLDREARYWISRSLIQLKRYEEARSILMELVEPPIHQPYWLVRWVYLSLAQIEYQEGNSKAAEQWLDRVLVWKDIKDSQDKARLLKRKKDQVGMFEIDFR